MGTWQAIAFVAFAVFCVVAYIIMASEIENLQDENKELRKEKARLEAML